MIKKSHIIDNDIITITNTSYNNGTFMPTHYHDKTAISFILRGSINETVNDEATLGGIANVIIKPSNTLHKDIFSNNCSIICVYLNAENELKNSIQDVLKNWSWIHSLDNYYFLQQILESQNEKDQLHIINEFIAYYFEQQKTKKYDQPPQWLTELKNILDASYNESLKSKDLAKVFGIHPVYMARVFKRFYGQSIKSYLNILRANGSMAAIANEESKLAHIALDNGYSDQSHLNRKFKDITGLTPFKFKTLIN